MAVVGGGVIGSTVAWRAAETGRSVILIDPAVESSASWVAGGMLAPVAEAWPGEEPLLELGSQSLDLWPEFAGALVTLGYEPRLRTEGTLVLGADSADRETLDTLAAHLARLDRKVEPLRGRELRRLEPSVGPGVRWGLSVPGDLAVDNRLLLRALRAAAADAGARHLATTASALSPLRCDDGSLVRAETVVLAAGAWSARLHPALAHAVRPVKGEVLRLRARAGSLPPPGRTVRGLVEGRAVYLVPRCGGELVLGATQYEAGFDTDPVAGGVRDLLTDAERFVPAIADYAVTEVRAGLRAGSADNMPVIDWIAPGVLAATGHHRNGFLLAPLTALLVRRLLDGADPEPAVAASGRARMGEFEGGSGR